MTVDDLKNTTKDIADRAGKSARQAGGAAKDAADDLGESAHGLADRAGETASSLYGRARDKASDVASNMADAMPGSADDAIAAGRQAYNRGSEHLSRQVAKQPIEALLLAGAIGFLVGWAANRS